MAYSVNCPSCNTSFPVDPQKVPEEGVLAQCSYCPEVFEVMRPGDSEAAPTFETTAVAVEEPAAEIETPVASIDPEDLVIETAEGVLEADAPAATIPEVHEETTGSLGGREITFDEPITSLDPVLEETSVAEPEVELAPEPEVEVAPEPEAELAQEPEVELALEPEVEVTPEPEVDVAPEQGEEAAPAVEESVTPSVAPIQFGRRDPSDKAKSLARSLVSDIVAYHRDKHTQSLAAGTLAEDFEEEVQKSWKEYTDQVDGDVVASSTFFNDALNEILAGGEGIFNLDG